jgi:3-isopropylmalate dehydrogenase
VHKNTVFKLRCGMFVEECYRAAEEFPEVEVDDVIVGTFSLRLQRDPGTGTQRDMVEGILAQL